MVTLIICFFVTFGIIAGYLLFIQPKATDFRVKLEKLCNVSVSNDSKVYDPLLAEAHQYSAFNQTSEYVRLKVRNLNFLIPEKPNEYYSASDIMDKSASTITKESLAFAGEEQFILMAFPPDQIVNSLLFSVESLIHHASAASLENLLTVKATLIEGAANLHDPEVLLACLKQYSHAVFEHLRDPGHLQTLFHSIDQQHTLNIFHSFVNWHTVTNGLEPAFHFQEHYTQMAHSWGNHAFDAGHQIIHHVHTTLTPEFHGHFPMLTLVMSSVREIQLINQDKTTINNAVKNVALDAVGTGAGALAGGKAGAAIGLFFGPIGAAAGGIIGGVVGGMLGRFGTNRIKKQALKDACETYEWRVSRMHSDMRDVAVNCVNTIRQESIPAKRRYYQIIGMTPAFEKDSPELSNEVRQLVIRQREAIHQLQQQLENFKSSPFAHFPSNKKRIVDLSYFLNAVRNKLPNDELLSKDPLAALHQLKSNTVIITEGYHENIVKSTDTIMQHHERLTSMLVIWTLNAANEYKNTLDYVLNSFHQQRQKFQEKDLGWRNTLEGDIDKINIEKQKLGLG